MFGAVSGVRERLPLPRGRGGLAWDDGDGLIERGHEMGASWVYIREMRVVRFECAVRVFSHHVTHTERGLTVQFSITRSVAAVAAVADGKDARRRSFFLLPLAWGGDMTLYTFPNSKNSDP